VSAEEGSSIDVVDVAARAVTASIPVGKRPRAIAFSPDGQRAYVACEVENTLAVIDVPGRKTLAQLKMPGKVASGVVLTPDGKRVIVSDGKAGALYAVDPARNEVVATVQVGARPWNMAVLPDGRKLYVANGRSNSVSVIDLATFKKLVDVPVGELPWGVAVR
jgi:YVTN family beta-propeller protein